MLERVILASLLIAAGRVAMAEALRFEANVIGRPPAGWTVAKTDSGEPKWSVEEDTTAPSGSKVVQQSGRATYPLLLKNGITVKDRAIEVHFKPTSDSEDRAGGLVGRANDVKRLLRRAGDCA
jgi:hypothetical protein